MIRVAKKPQVWFCLFCGKDWPGNKKKCDGCGTWKGDDEPFQRMTALEKSVYHKPKHSDDTLCLGL